MPGQERRPHIPLFTHWLKEARAAGSLVRLSLQPGSALTQWFHRRFAGAGKRMRRVDIVALARRLAIALWRYLEHGVVSQGAHLKRRAAA